MMQVDTMTAVFPAVAAFAVLAGSPGPATLAVAATAMARGRAPALALSAGLTLGLAAWGSMALFGLGAALPRWAGALTLLKFVGGAYLLWLAWQSARSALYSGRIRPVARRGADVALFRRGLLLNLLNPKAALAWLATLVIASPATEAVTSTMTVTTTLCALLGAVIYGAYATIFSTPALMAGYVRFRRRVEAGLAALFAVAGLRLMFSRLGEGGAG